jgi:hypothetical protein
MDYSGKPRINPHMRPLDHNLNSGRPKPRKIGSVKAFNGNIKTPPASNWGVTDRGSFFGRIDFLPYLILENKQRVFQGRVQFNGVLVGYIADRELGVMVCQGGNYLAFSF